MKVTVHVSISQSRNFSFQLQGLWDTHVDPNVKFQSRNRETFLFNVKRLNAPHRTIRVVSISQSRNFSFQPTLPRGCQCGCECFNLAIEKLFFSTLPTGFTFDPASRFQSRNRETFIFNRAGFIHMGYHSKVSISQSRNFSFQLCFQGFISKHINVSISQSRNFSFQPNWWRWLRVSVYRFNLAIEKLFFSTVALRRSYCTCFDA